MRCYCSCLKVLARFPLGTGEYIFAHTSLFGSCSYKLKLIVIFSMINSAVAPSSGSSSRGRGSSSRGSLPNINDIIPNTQRDYDFLPGVNRWDGIPFHAFELIWLTALLFALGSISMDGITLRQTAEDDDPYSSSGDATGLAFSNPSCCTTSSTCRESA